MNKKVPNILVVGDIILDHYLSGKTNRISPEAPVPIVEYESEEWVLGGAANVANNLVSLGAGVSLVGIIGNDKSGEIIKNITKSKCIGDLISVSDDRITTIKTRVVSSNHQLLRIDREDRHAISEDEVSEIVKNITQNINTYDCIIISDYSKGLLTDILISRLIDLANNNKIKVLVDPKSPPFSKFSGAYLIKPNRKEAFLETGINIVDEDSFYLAAQLIKNRTGCHCIVITLSEDGVGLFDDNIKRILPTEAKDIFDVTGAGDTFIATLAYGIGMGKSIIESCKLANYASGIVVGKYGCEAITLKEIEIKL